MEKLNRQLIYFVDIDETICYHSEGNPEARIYTSAKPIVKNIEKINKLYASGARIVYWTARGSRTLKDWRELTTKQLLEWGCLYHELRLDKPYYDRFFDDKGVNLDFIDIQTDFVNSNEITEITENTHGQFEKIETDAFTCKPILISHRGNITGPEESRENSMDFIDEAISAGYDVEIDVRYINANGKNMFMLGHDFPVYEVDINWLIARSNKLWIHAKNASALHELLKRKSLRVFYHSCDAHTIVSSGHIWTHDLSQITKSSIIPLIDDTYLKGDLKLNTAYLKDIQQQCYAVCSDYVEQFREIFNVGKK